MINWAPIKNGPNAKRDFKVLVPQLKSIIPTIAPLIKAPNNVSTIMGQPLKKPKASASLTSPKPMPRPRVTSHNRPKKPAAASAAAKPEIKLLSNVKKVSGKANEFE